MLKKKKKKVVCQLKDKCYHRTEWKSEWICQRWMCRELLALKIEFFVKLFHPITHHDCVCVCVDSFKSRRRLMCMIGKSLRSQTHDVHTSQAVSNWRRQIFLWKVLMLPQPSLGIIIIFYSIILHRTIDRSERKKKNRWNEIYGVWCENIFIFFSFSNVLILI